MERDEKNAPAPGAEPERQDDSQEERHQMVLSIWKQQPGLGPSQIRNQLKRKGFKISVNTVRAIMEEHGYVQPKVRRKDQTGEYEAVRPLQLYHLDFGHFFVHRQKQCMLLMKRIEQGHGADFNDPLSPDSRGTFFPRLVSRLGATRSTPSSG